MDHSVADEIVILAVIEHWHAHHPRVFDRAPHQLVVLDAAAVVGDRDDAGLFERTDRRQLFAHQALRDRARRQHVHASDFRRAITNPADRSGTIGHWRAVRHGNDRREPARRRRPRA